jgi:hypothetical protein
MSESELNFTKSLFAESEAVRKELERQLAEQAVTIARQLKIIGRLNYDPLPCEDCKERDATIARLREALKGVLGAFNASAVRHAPDPIYNGQISVRHYQEAWAALSEQSS